MIRTKHLALAATIGAVFAVFAACSSDGGEASNGFSGYDGGKSGTGGGSGGGTGGESGGTMIDSGVTTDASDDASLGDAACSATTMSATLARANILFSIDRTGSMNCNAPPTQTTAVCNTTPKKVDATKLSKWEMVRDALKVAINGLESTAPLPSVGIMFFNNNDKCGIPDTPQVDVAALSGDASKDPQLNAFVLSLNEVVPKGDTPIVGAMMRAYFYMHANKKNLEGNRFVVLLTDGAETCDPTNKPFLIEKVKEAASVGIRTFVLGAPGSEGEKSFLSTIAYWGGTPSTTTCTHDAADPGTGDCHMDMTSGANFAQELADNLKKISGVALSCEFEIPDPPDGGKLDYDKVNVNYSSGGGAAETFPKDDTKACTDPNNAGWQYSSNKTKIVLCGKACEKVKTDAKASVSIALGCETEIIK